MALTRDGDTYYREDEYDGYWDVDPVPGTKYTVIHAATDELRDACPNQEPCTRNVVRRVNLSTGSTELLYSRIVPGHFNNEWHDIDRIDDETIVVADMENNRVFLVNTTTGIIEWEWEAQSHFDVTEGGSEYFGTGYPGDWTHINDVEVLDDGRIMVSVRNFDQVVFLNRSDGVVDEWTLGSDNEHNTLNEQHNPDYIPASNGGPAVLVADSHNNRVVEYQRSEGSWTRTWQWSDTQLNWPRDADRLPNGHTLVTDTNGDRILEVDRDGSIVWSVEVEGPYEAERLGTGSESRGGPSASSANLDSKRSSVGDKDSINPTRIVLFVKNILPDWIVISLLFVIPSWLSASGLFWLLGGLGTLGLWALVEYRWHSVQLSVQSPIRFD